MYLFNYKNELSVSTLGIGVHVYPMLG